MRDGVTRYWTGKGRMMKSQVRAKIRKARKHGSLRVIGFAKMESQKYTKKLGTRRVYQVCCYGKEFMQPIETAVNEHCRHCPGFKMAQGKSVHETKPFPVTPATTASSRKRNMDFEAHSVRVLEFIQNLD